MKNKDIKKTLIENGTFNEYRKQRFNMFEELKPQIEKETDLQKRKELSQKIYDYQNYFDENGEQFSQLQNQCCQELKEARKKQVKKIREHFIFWLNNDYKIFFGTFTYDDNKFKPKDKNGNFITDQIKLSLALKKQVIRNLSPICDDYIINIDYGKENERLHYHCLVAIKSKNITKDYWYELEKRNKGTKEKPKWIQGEKLIHKNLLAYENKIGWFDMEPCKDDETSAKKLSRYIDKLTLHSIKVKQNYVAVKKGTEYQKDKTFKKIILNVITNSQINNANSKKEKNAFATNEIYLNALKLNKKLVSTENYCEMEYNLLSQERKLKEQQLISIEKKKKEKSKIHKLFDTSIDLEEIKKHAKYFEGSSLID